MKRFTVEKTDAGPILFYLGRTVSYILDEEAEELAEELNKAVLEQPSMQDLLAAKHEYEVMQKRYLKNNGWENQYIREHWYWVKDFPEQDRKIACTSMEQAVHLQMEEDRAIYSRRRQEEKGKIS